MKRDRPAKAVERMFPFVLRAGLLLVGREKLRRSMRQLQFVLLTTDATENFRSEVLAEFAHYPVVHHFTSKELGAFFRIEGAKVVGFAKSSLAKSIYAELKPYRINAPVSGSSKPDRLPAPVTTLSPPTVSFNTAQRTALREELQRNGFTVDTLISENPDVPTFGLNLACVWPFPPEWHKAFEKLHERLNALDRGAYVYPLPCTHITLATLINFARHVQPEAAFTTAWQRRIPELVDLLSPLFAVSAPDRITTFNIEPETPALARAAAFLPMRNQDGEVARLRQRLRELLQARTSWHSELTAHGLNVPGILHSTIMRFSRPPANQEVFLAAFDAIAKETTFPKLEVTEVLLTAETKPYMRGGEVLHRFRLAPPSSRPA